MNFLVSINFQSLKISNSNKNRLIQLVIILPITMLLIVISFYNYLLFHLIVELSAVTVAWSVFILVWNARKIKISTGFVLVGIAYALVGCLDLIHIVSYKGMSVLQIDEANTATQLWISARYIEAAVLLYFPLSFSMYFPLWAGLIILTSATGTLLGAIFLWDVFPICFDPETGLTLFKIISEYVIICILCTAGLLTWYQWEFINERIAPLLIGSIVLTIFSEFSFTLYKDPYGLTNMIGHLLKVTSFYLLYRALIVEGLERPLETLGLKLHEESIRYAKIIETSADGFWIVDMEGRICNANKAASMMVGYGLEELTNMRVSDVDASESPEETIRHIRILKERGYERFESIHKRKDGRTFDVEVSCSYLPHLGGQIIAFVRDITERKRSENRLKMQASLLNQVSDAIIATDMDLHITSWNSAATKIYGWTETEALGMHLDEFLGTQWFEETIEGAQSILSENGVWKGEIRQKSKEGRNLTVEAACLMASRRNGKYYRWCNG